MDLSERPSFAVFTDPLQAQFEAFLDEHRVGLRRTLDGLTDEQATRRLVPSATTLLGVLKHAIFVEQVFFDQAITHRTRAEIGMPATVDESFEVGPGDTVAAVVASHEQVCAASRNATAQLGVDDLLTGTRFGPLPLRWVYLHVLRELAQHQGHADILREQILAADGAQPPAP